MNLNEISFSWYPLDFDLSKGSKRFMRLPKILENGFKINNKIGFRWQ